MCIRTSGGWTVPIGGVYGLEEDKHSLMVLIRLMRQHCVDHGVDAHIFNKRVPDIPSRNKQMQPSRQLQLLVVAQ